MASFRIEYEPPRFAMSGQSRAGYQKSYMTPSMVLCSYWYVLCTEYILYLYLYSGNYTCIYDDTCDVDGDKVRLNQVTCIASARCSSLLLQYDTVWQRVLPLLYISSRIHIPCVSIQTLVRYAMFSARHKEA